MSREYVVSTGGVTLVNAVCTLAFINPGASASLEILRMWASQSANAVSAQQRVQTNTQVTAFPTLTSLTPRKLKFNDQVSAITGATNGAAGTAGVNATAEGAGTKSPVHEDAFNVLNGHLLVFTPSETMIMPAGATSGFGYHFPAAALTLNNWACGVVFREF